MKIPWTLHDMPRQDGRAFVVTGANDGLGFHLTRAFAGKGGRVIMACRTAEKAERARRSVLESHSGARLDVVPLDLGSLDSVAACAASLVDREATIDGIICNAGIMAVPFGITADGLELQMGVNYYGHYALVGRLMSLVRRSPGIRVVTVTSAAQRFATLRLSGQPSADTYRRWGAYCDSKLAILMLALVLDEKLRAEGLDAIALSAHPGFARTNLRKTRLETERDPLQRALLGMFERWAMPAEQGMLPVLYAATDSGAQGGDFVGVSGVGEIRGWPKLARPQRRARDPRVRERLLCASEGATGVHL